MSDMICFAVGSAGTENGLGMGWLFCLYFVKSLDKKITSDLTIICRSYRVRIALPIVSAVSERIKKGFARLTMFFPQSIINPGDNE